MDLKPPIYCRICTQRVDKLINIFTEKLPSSNLLIFDFLHQLTNLEIQETDDISNFICNNCWQKLLTTNDFIQLCINSTINFNLREQIIIEIEKSDPDDSQTEIKQNPLKKKTKEIKCSKNKAKTDEFHCNICNQPFRYAYLLKQHKFKHTSEKPFPCTECPKGCLTAESLRRHMKIHDENYVKKMHNCHICSKEFPYASCLTEHMKNHTGERPHLCPTCGKGFRQSGALRYHLRAHSGVKPYACSVCNGNFMSKSVLKVHMRKHTNERPYVCHVCGMAFRQATDLRRHQTTHSGEKPVLCPICGKRMSTTGQLTVHIRTHTGEKPFLCAHCSKSFTTKPMLVKHERIHTGERPYVCDICRRAFNQSSTLNSHKKTHAKQGKATIGRLRESKGFPGECMLYKTEIGGIEAEKLQDIEVKNSGHENTFLVHLPAPIPLIN